MSLYSDIASSSKMTLILSEKASDNKDLIAKQHEQNKIVWLYGQMNIISYGNIHLICMKVI